MIMAAAAQRNSDRESREEPASDHG